MAFIKSGARVFPITSDIDDYKLAGNSANAKLADLKFPLDLAWLGMGGWTGIALASLLVVVWRHPLASVAARAIAPVGATFAFLCLATGSIWGRPTWGTWWECDGRMTSMLRPSA